MKPGICTHITEVPIVRTVTFSNKAPSDWRHIKNANQRERRREFGQNVGRGKLEAGGKSGITAPATYRAQLAREALARGELYG